MKNLIFIIKAVCYSCCFFCTVALQAQDIDIVLDNPNSIDKSGTVLELENGHLLLVGSTENGVSGTSGMDGYIFEYDPNNQRVVWSRTYDVGENGAHTTDHLYTGIIDSEGYAVVGGSSQGSGHPYMWIMRVDLSAGNQGNVLFSKRLNEGKNNRISEIEQTLDADPQRVDYLFTGPSENFTEVYLGKIRYNGNVIFENTYNDGTERGWAYCITQNNTQDHLGRIYLGGSIRSSLFDMMVAEIQSNGQLNKFKYYEEANNRLSIIDDLHFIDGELVGSGHIHTSTSAGAENSRPCFVKIDVNTYNMTTKRLYNTTDGSINRFVELQPIVLNNQHVGYVATVSSDELSNGALRAKVVYMDVDGYVLPNGYKYLSEATRGGAIKQLKNNRLIYFGMTAGNDELYLNEMDATPTDPTLSCINLNDLEDGSFDCDISNLIEAYTPVNTDPQNVRPTIRHINWNAEAYCCDDFEVAINGANTVCSGGSLTLSVPALTGATYQWSNGATTNSTSVQPNSSTTYTVTVTNRFNCESVAQRTVTVAEPPVVSIDDCVKKVCLGDRVILWVNNPVSGVTYSWTGGYTGTQVVIPVTTLGSQLITVTANNSTGCTNAASVEVVGIDCGEGPITKPNTSDRVDNRTPATLDHLELFPNPTQNQLNILMEQQSEAQWIGVELYDLHGRLLISQSMHANQATLNVADLSVGLYVIRVQSANGQQQTKQFVKE
jgi:hypothetical protein